MSPEKKKSGFFKKAIMRSIRWPIVYFILGLILTTLSYIDEIFPLTQWKRLFELTDKVGNIFMAIAVLTFIYNFAVMICRRYERKSSDDHKVASLIVSTLRKGLRIIFALVAVNIIITVIGPTKLYLVFANNIINTIIICAIGWIAIQVFYTFEAVIYQHMLTLQNEQHIRAKALYTKMHIIRNITTVVIVIITIAAVLMSFSSVRNIGISLLASAGFLTAIVGLSAQKTLFSLFSGLQIALAQPIKIGDIVVVEKESGLIEEITFTYVTLKLGDRRRLVVPISYFIEKPFENWSRDYDSLRSSFYMHVDYTMPIDPLRTELENILRGSQFWDGKAMKLQVSNLTERSVELRIQVSAANADNLSDLRAEVREKILGFIHKNYPDHFPTVRLNS